MYSGSISPTFRRKVRCPFRRSKIKKSKRQARSRQQAASILQIEAVLSSESSVDSYRTTRRHNPEYNTLYNSPSLCGDPSSNTQAVLCLLRVRDRVLYSYGTTDKLFYCLIFQQLSYSKTFCNSNVLISESTPCQLVYGLKICHNFRGLSCNFYVMI